VDSTTNKVGEVTKVAILEIHYKGYQGKHTFFVAKVDHNKILLSYPFLEAINPKINWQSEKLYGAITLKGNYKGDDSKITKITVAQQLSKAATDKTEQT
jgi:hypothetical protein